MKKPRFLCIAPYEGMYHLMTNIAAQRDDVELVIQSGNLDDGLKTALDNRRGIDAVISRGGTADVLRGHMMDIPICDIVPSAYDILRTIRLAQGMDDDFRSSATRASRIRRKSSVRSCNFPSLRSRSAARRSAAKSSRRCAIRERASSSAI